MFEQYIYIKGLISKICKELIKHQKMNNLIKKWAKDLDFFSKDIQTAMKRCSTNHQGNTNNQNQWHPHTRQNGCYWKTTNNNQVVWYGKHRTLVNCRWECKLVQTLWKTVNRFPQKLKNRTTIGPSNSTPGYLSEKNEDTKLENT